MTFATAAEQLPIHTLNTSTATFRTYFIASGSPKTGTSVYVSTQDATEISTGAPRPNQQHTILLCSLDNPELSVRLPFKISLDSHGERNFVACFENAGAFASGDTKGEAIANLKDVIAFKFLRYKYLTTDRLSMQVAREFASLKKHIRLK
jgi:hypothetical protein